MSCSPKSLLIAEDNESDFMLLQFRLGRAGMKNPIHWVTNGDEVIEYLKGEGDYANRTEFPFPAVVFLDLNMPRKNGFEVLDWLKTFQHPTELMPKVIVLTVFQRSDIQSAYQLGAHSFLLKPVAQGELQSTVEGLKGLEFQPQPDGVLLTRV